MLLEVPPFQTDRQQLLVLVLVPMPMGLQTNRQQPQVPPPPQTNRLPVLVLVLVLPWLLQSLTMVLGMLPILRRDRRRQLAQQCQTLLLLAKEAAMQVETTHQLVALL